MIYQLAFDTFIGARSENQDSILNIKIAEDVFLVGIADGMGGMAGGKLASSLAVEAITDYIQSLSLDQFEGENLKNILSSCYDIAGFSIQKAKERQPEFSGMGTTLSLLLICGDMYVWSNLGDSRIYEIGNDSIKLITVDHTLVQQLSRMQRTDLEESVTLKYDHVLTKCLDGSGEPPDIFPVEKDYLDLDEDVYFMLCSDGMILDKSDSDQTKLMQMIAKNNTVQNAVTDLISYAYSEGSQDNISVGVVRVFEAQHAKSFEKVQKGKRNVKLYNGVIYLLLALIVLVPGGIFISSIDIDFDDFRGQPQSTEVPREANFRSVWKPLDIKEYSVPVGSEQDLFWTPHPRKEMIRYYHVVVMSETEVLLEKYFKNSHNFLATQGLDLQEGELYTLAVDAISKSDKRIEGNSVEFTYKPN